MFYLRHCYRTRTSQHRPSPLCPRAQHRTLHKPFNSAPFTSESWAPLFIFYDAARPVGGSFGLLVLSYFLFSSAYVRSIPVYNPSPGLGQEHRKMTACSPFCLCARCLRPPLPLLTISLPLMPSLSLWECERISDLRPPLELTPHRLSVFATVPHSNARQSRISSYLA